MRPSNKRCVLSQKFSAKAALIFEESHSDTQSRVKLRRFIIVKSDINAGGLFVWCLTLTYINWFLPQDDLKCLSHQNGFLLIRIELKKLFKKFYIRFCI